MKRPAKPRITKPRLTWRWDPRRKIWIPRHRTTWTEGGRQRSREITLDWQGDPQRLDDEYWRCEAGRHEKQAPSSRYTWGEIVRLWGADPRVKLKPSTRKSYMKSLAPFLVKNGEKDMRRTTRQGVRAKHTKMADTPRQADKLLAVLSLLWNYASQKRDWPLGSNPVAGIDRYGRQSEFQPWPEWMVTALATAPEDIQTAAQLILGTGQRPSAAIAMRWEQFNGEWVEVTDQKGGEVFEIYCPESLTRHLDTIPRRGAHVLAKNLTEPLSYDAVAARFARWRAGLGARASSYSLHGLRKLAVVELAEAGCSDAQIQSVTGQSAATVAHYRKGASSRRLSKSAQIRRNRT